MKTDRQDPLPTIAEAERELYETALDLNLRRLMAWTALPDERTDWDLEQLLQDIGAGALALRRLRSDQAVPF